MGEVLYPEGRNQFSSILVPDSGLLVLGPVGACISHLFKVGTLGQGIGIGWEVRCCILTSTKKGKVVLYNPKPYIVGAMG